MEIKEIRQQKSEMVKLLTTAELRAKLKHISGLLFCLSADIGLQENELQRLQERNEELEDIAVKYHALVKIEKRRESQRQLNKQRYREKIEKSLIADGQTSNQKE